MMSAASPRTPGTRFPHPGFIAVASLLLVYPSTICRAQCSSFAGAGGSGRYISANVAGGPTTSDWPSGQPAFADTVSETGLHSSASSTIDASFANGVFHSQVHLVGTTDGSAGAAASAPHTYDIAISSTVVVRISGSIGVTIPSVHDYAHEAGGFSLERRLTLGSLGTTIYTRNVSYSAGTSNGSSPAGAFSFQTVVAGPAYLHFNASPVVDLLGIFPGQPGDSGTGTLDQDVLIEVLPFVPTVTPSTWTACVGGSATFTASIYGPSPSSYEWRHNGVPVTNVPGHITGATTASLGITGALAADAGEYVCVPTSGCGSVASNPVTLAVCPADLDDGTGSGACDGGTDVSDLLFFLANFEAGSIANADLDNGSGTGSPDGGVDINDLLYFLAHFEAGC